MTKLWLAARTLPFLCFFCALGAAEHAIHFVDRAQEGGVTFQVRNAAAGEKYQIETMIAGVGLFDYDNDGLLDLYFCNGAEIPKLTKGSGEYWNRLYRNLGSFRFQDVTEEAGVRGEGYSMGVSAGDYDNDGWTDLYVTGVNRNILYRNQGDGTFRDVTRAAGVEGLDADGEKLWAVGAGWLDFDQDGDLDLFVVNYCVWSLEKDPRCGAPRPGYRTYCHPDMYAPLPNLLYRNEGDGTFTDVSRESGIAEHTGKGMGVTFSDFDRDGRPDIFVSNDAWRNFLFLNQGEGTFREGALEAGVAYIDSGREVSGMGTDSGDYDNDGLPDIFLTALSNETFPLFRNLGSGLFRDERFSTGLGVMTLPYGGWSTGMVDFDNDGFLDLFTAGGHVQTNEELYSNRASRQSNRVFLNTRAGRFTDVTQQAGSDLQQTGLHRGAAFGDLDNDGRVDIVVTRLHQPVEIFHNQTRSAGNFLTLQLRGVWSNRQGLDAEVVAELSSGESLLRRVTTAVGYGGSSDPRLHFGLGDDEVSRISILWPSGTRQVVRAEDRSLSGFVAIQETGDEP